MPNRHSALQLAMAVAAVSAAYAAEGEPKSAVDKMRREAFPVSSAGSLSKRQARKANKAARVARRKQRK